MPAPAIAQMLAAGEGEPAPFNPLTQVTCLHGCWADDPSWTNPGDGNPVDSWRNQSGGGDPASTGGNRPTFDSVNAAYNNHATVTFVAASSQRLDVDVANTSQPYKIVAVGDVGSSGVGERLVGMGNNTTRGLGDASTDLWIINAGSALTAGAVDGSPHVFRATFNGASSQLWVDEASIASGASGSATLARLTIGSGSDNIPAFALFLNGDVAFVGIYDGATSDASLSTLCDDLATYYGTP